MLSYVFVSFFYQQVLYEASALFGTIVSLPPLEGPMLRALVDAFSELPGEEANRWPPPHVQVDVYIYTHIPIHILIWVVFFNVQTFSDFSSTPLRSYLAKKPTDGRRHTYR